MTLAFDLATAELAEATSLENYHVSQEERDAAIERAENEGFEVIRSDPYHLLLDFDEKYVPGKKYGNAEVWDLLARDKVTHPGTREYWASKSGNTHCIMGLTKPLSAPHRIALQAALGSDPKREALSVLRLLNGIEEPSLLFKPKAK